MMIKPKPTTSKPQVQRIELHQLEPQSPQAAPGGAVHQQCSRAFLRNSIIRDLGFRVQGGGLSKDARYWGFALLGAVSFGGLSV